MSGTETKWLIWSNEHNAWWKPNSKGYTKDKADAGRYDFGEAVDLVMEANTSNGLYFARKTPDETMCPDWPQRGDR